MFCFKTGSRGGYITDLEPNGKVKSSSHILNNIFLILLHLSDFRKYRKVINFQRKCPILEGQFDIMQYICTGHG